MLVDVPKSTTTQAVPHNWCAARVFTTRSAPTSRGLSTSSGTPVRTPGPTTTLGRSVRRSSSNRNSRSRLGTVDSAAMALTCGAYWPSRARTATSSSSAVIRGSVRIRQSRISGGRATEADVVSA